MLAFNDIEIDTWREPPRPAIAPRRRVQAYRMGVAGQDDYVEDWGLRNARIVRFASSTEQGLLTPEEVASLVNLYEAGASFALTTDLLKELGGAADTYPARFDPDTVPAFTPATPDGSLFYFDMVVLV
jgi:hypothetical protein